MRIVSEETLDLFRGSGTCSWCNRWCESLDAAHVYGRGHAGGLRMDVRINLVSLCRRDHDLHHAGKSPTRAELLEVVATREGETVGYIVDEINRLRREPKGGRVKVLRSEEDIREAADVLARALAGMESPAVRASLAALLWVLGEGAFGREMLGPLRRLQRKAGGQ